MKPTDFQLLTIVVEPKARKAVAKEFGLPSGALPVLAAIAFNKNQGDSIRPYDLYRAEMGTKNLIRGYVAALVKANLVEHSTYFRTRFLRLTWRGDQVVSKYERAIKEGCTEFSNTHAMRVVTKPINFWPSVPLLG